LLLWTLSLQLGERFLQHFVLLARAAAAPISIQSQTLLPYHGTCCFRLRASRFRHAGKAHNSQATSSYNSIHFRFQWTVRTPAVSICLWKQLLQLSRWISRLRLLPKVAFAPLGVVNGKWP